MPITIRQVSPDADHEIELIARRMRDTLTEVLGPRGESMYTLDWLMQRVRHHLDPEACDGQVFVAVTTEDDIVGHTIVRIQPDHDGTPIGLFSTTYVLPAQRRQGLASDLLRVGEQWMRDRQAPRAVTYTDRENRRLIELYRRHGYEMTDADDDFVRLWRPLS